MLNFGSFPNSLLWGTKHHGPSTDFTSLRQIPIDFNSSFVWEMIAGCILLFLEKVSVLIKVDEAVFFIAVKQLGLEQPRNLTMIMGSGMLTLVHHVVANHESLSLLCTMFLN